MSHPFNNNNQPTRLRPRLNKFMTFLMLKYLNIHLRNMEFNLLFKNEILIKWLVNKSQLFFFKGDKKVMQVAVLRH